MFKHPAWIGALTLLLSSFGWASPAEHGSGDPIPYDHTEYENLLAILDEETRIATKTRLNADHVPGIITVLDGAQLEARGIQTVWEALGLVPGIELSMEETGRRQVLVRGIGHSYASGNIKYMLDGIALNSGHLALAAPLLEMPIAQVERIEMIRGPGSAVHGEFAYTGVVNIITRRQSRRLYTGYGRFNSRAAGVLLGGGDSRGLRGALNVATSDSDGARLQVENDWSDGQGYAPGPINDRRSYRSALLSLGFGKTQLSGGTVRQSHGDHFGINLILPPPDRRDLLSDENQLLEAEQHFDIGSLSGKLYAGWLETRTEAENMFIARADDDADRHINTRYGEVKQYGGMDLAWRGARRHHLLASVAYSRTEVTDAEAYVDKAFTDEQGITWDPDNDYHPVTARTQRTVRSFALQDEFRASDRFTVTAGMRYDHYDDIGASTTPRVAAVWRQTPNHIFKAQYGKAFRPPTFHETGVAGNAIGTAIVKTWEFGYIHRAAYRTERATLFYSNLEDRVWFDRSANEYANDSATSMGVELEWEYRFGPRWRLDGNLSYVETEQAATRAPLAGTTDWLGNLTILYRPSGRSLLSTRLIHVGDRYREANDERSALRGYQTVDLTLTLFDRFVSGLDVRAGVKNLTDAEVRLPAPENSYSDDYLQPGRIWWGQVSYNF